MKNRILLASLLAAISVLFSVGLSAQERSTTQRKDSKRSTEVRSTNNNGSEETTINYSDDDHRYNIRLDGKKIVELLVDGAKIPAEDYSKYQKMVDKIIVQVEADRKQAEKDRAQADLDRKQAEKDRAQAEKDRAQADLDRKQADKDRAQAETDRNHAEKDRERAIADRERANGDRRQAEKDRGQAELDRQQAEKDRAQAAVDRKQAEADRKLIDEMFTSIVKDNIADSKEAIRYLVLSDKEFSVNDVKQSEKVHAQYRDKYLKDKTKRITYRNETNFRGISID